MNYLGAKSELQQKPPKLSFKTLALEVVVMLVAANALVALI